ncbi:MAG: SEC-C domain-containing protein [Thalassotalea sp.]|nr:SEC-C domain-containing protein [Thalassotalea sp.]
MNLCPCCSGASYQTCCQPLHLGEKPASSPLSLMRSRYSAYALSHFEYVFNTYANQQRANLTVRDLADSSQSTIWVKLDIHQSPASDNNVGQVEFSAFYIVDNDLYEMRELSDFILEQGLWRYTSGDIITNSRIRVLKRNDACPCDSGKKYKKCCGAN